MNDIVTLFTTIISTGVISSIGTFLATKKKETRTDFTEIINRWEEDNKRLREQNIKMQEELERLKVQVIDLSAKIILLESSNQDLPFPMWLKDTNGTMLALNSRYCDVFLIPQAKTEKDYIGKKDTDVWGEAVAEMFRKADLKVIKNKKSFHFIQDIPIAKAVHKWHIIKFPRFVGNTLVGIAGVAIPVDLKNEELIS